MPLTDEDLLDSFLKSDTWVKQWRREIEGKGRRWELPNPIRTFLRNFFHVAHGQPTPLEVEQTTHRLVRLYRSRNARKAARTRMKRTLKDRQRRFSALSKRFDKVSKKIRLIVERRKKEPEFNL